MITYSCGCILGVHNASGALYTVAKCDRHRAKMREPATLDEAYYAQHVPIVDGKLMPSRHVAEMEEAIGGFERPRGNRAALEIGCGVSPYVGAVQAAGWTYHGYESSEWASEWTCHYWGVPVHLGRWPEWRGGKPLPFGMILCAHALEHMADAPTALAKMTQTLEPGGVLYLLVPDDSDPLNPDHLWFFNESSLRRCVEMAGLTVETMVKRRIVERENFLYCRARKPA